MDTRFRILRTQRWGEEIDHERIARGDAAQWFLKEFLDGLRLDDPEQPIAKPARREGRVSFSLPASNKLADWVSVICSEERWHRCGVLGNPLARAP